MNTVTYYKRQDGSWQMTTTSVEVVQPEQVPQKRRWMEEEELIRDWCECWDGRVRFDFLFRYWQHLPSSDRSRLAQEIYKHLPPAKQMTLARKVSQEYIRELVDAILACEGGSVALAEAVSVVFPYASQIQWVREPDPVPVSAAGSVEVAPARSSFFQQLLVAATAVMTFFITK